MKKIEVRVEGTSPLMQHRYPIDQMEDAKKTKKATASLADYKSEAETSLYRDAKGNIFQPSCHFEGTITKAATSFKMKGARGRSFKDLFRAAIIVEPEEIPLEHPDKWTVDARPVVVQRNRVIRYRPKFEKWACEFTIQVLDDTLQADTIKEILEHAGNFVGIGDYRPKYGRFKVTKFQEVTS